MTGPSDDLGLDAAWGARLADGFLVLRPRPSGSGTMAADRVRAGRTLLDLAVHRRTGRIIVRVAKRFGPDLGVDLAWDGPEKVSSVLLDDHAMGASPVRFLARHEHEAQFFLAEVVPRP